MKLPRAIIYPIKNGNHNDSGAELIFSLRSVAEFLGEDIPVFVISEREPLYLSDKVFYIKCSSYKDAMLKACSVAEEILWMNDDIFFLRPHTWDELRNWVKASGLRSLEQIKAVRSDGTTWAKRKSLVLEKLHNSGDTTYDYSTHSPYLYETDKLVPLIEEFDFGYKTAIETAYGNACKVKSRPCRILSRHHDKTLPLDCSSYDILNYSDEGYMDHLRGFLLGKFSRPSIFEDHGSNDPRITLTSTIK